MKQKKSQVSVEYFIIFGTLLVFLVSTVSYFMQTVPEEIRVKQATDVVNKISKVADTVYVVGPGTERFIYVYVPSGVQSITFANFPDSVGGEISLSLSYEGRTIELIAITKGNIMGHIDTGKTLYKLHIQTTEERIVNITSI